jgi:ABC-type glutathione transport system ATPase component
MEIQDQIRALVEVYNIGILLTDHQFRETVQVSDRIYVIREGRVFAYGNREQIVNNPEVRRHYIGERFDVGHLLDKHKPVAIPQAASRAEAREAQSGPAELEDLSSQQIITTEFGTIQGDGLSVQVIQPECKPDPGDLD